MKKGRSSGNGHQAEVLTRELRELNATLRADRRDRGKLIDNAIALAETEVGIGLGPERGAPHVTQGGTRTYPGGRGYNSLGGDGTVSAVPQPVYPLVGAAPSGRPGQAPYQTVPGQAQGPAPTDAAVQGVPGTPITSGFLLDLGEYNPELQGRLAIPYYEQMRRGDAQVRATLAACKLPVQSAKWDVVAAEPAGPIANSQGPRATARELANGHWPLASTGAGKQTQAKAKEVAQFVKDNLFGGLEYRSSSGALVTQSWDEVVRNALLMLDFGCAVHEDVWTIDGDQIRLRRLAARYPLTFYQWVVEEDGETLDTLIQYGYRRNQFLRVPLPAGKMCRFSYQQEAANFWGIALQRAMYPHWYVKSQLYRIDAIANERNALGIPVFKLAPGFSKEDREAAYNWVTSLAAHEATGLVEPPGDQYTGLRIVGYQGRLRDVMPSIQHHNSMISIAALAMFMQLGQEGRGGSRALGESHGSFFLLSLQNLADQIASAITCSTVRRLVAMNFGDDAPVPRLIAANVQSRDIAELATTLTQFAQAGLAISDEDLRDFIRQELALPAETPALKGAVAAPRGLTIADENDIKSGGEIQGKGAGQVESASTEPRQEQEPGARSQKAEGKTKATDVGAAPRGRPRSARDALRTVPSPFWSSDGGHDPDLRMVHPGETHVDFPAHQAELARSEGAVRGILARAKPGLVRRVADKMAAAIKRGTKPTAVSLDHDQDLQASIEVALSKTYAAAAKHVRDEHARLAKNSELRIVNGEKQILRSAQDDKTGDSQFTIHHSQFADAPKSRPSLIAEISVQDVLQDILNAGAHAANDLSASGRTGAMSAGQIADWLFGAIDDVAHVEDGIDKAAGEAARAAWRAGRSDEFAALAHEMARPGLTLHTIRVSVLEKNPCNPCREQDGEDWDPERPVSDICDDGSLCQCELMESGE